MAHFKYLFIYLASTYGYIKTVKLLFEKGANIHEKGFRDRTALMGGKQ